MLAHDSQNSTKNRLCTKLVRERMLVPGHSTAAMHLHSTQSIGHFCCSGAGSAVIAKVSWLRQRPKVHASTHLHFEEPGSALSCALRALAPHTTAQIGRMYMAEGGERQSEQLGFERTAAARPLRRRHSLSAGRRRHHPKCHRMTAVRSQIQRAPFSGLCATRTPNTARVVGSAKSRRTRLPCLHNAALMIYSAFAARR